MAPHSFSGGVATYVAYSQHAVAFFLPAAGSGGRRWSGGRTIRFPVLFLLITALMFLLDLISELGEGLREFWLIGLLFAIGLLKVAQDLVRRSRKTDPEEHGPLLVFGMGETPAPAVAPRATEPSAAPTASGPPPPVPAAPLSQMATPAMPMAPRRPSPRPIMSQPMVRRPVGVPSWDSTALTDEANETIRIETGDDGRVQFLPGRLEVVRGAEVGREFHFLRVPGQTVPEITIGRAHGPAHRHVQIPAATVSRMHALLRFVDRGWWVVNLSTTNPVRVNGVELAGPDDTVLLSDGDSLALGEVELRYRDTRA